MNSIATRPVRPNASLLAWAGLMLALCACNGQSASVAPQTSSPQEHADGSSVTFQDFATGQPGAGDCLRMQADGWYSDNCGWPSNGALPTVVLNQLPYICESACGNGSVDAGESCDPPGPTCSKTCHTIASCTESGGVSLPENGHCYFPTSTTQLYPSALASACPSGTHLATLNEVAETEAALKAAGSSDSWIAMSAMQTEAVFKWDVGTEIFNASRYHDFGGNDPNQSPPACVVVTNQPPSGTAGWRDRACSDSYVSLCERDK